MKINCNFPKKICIFPPVLIGFKNISFVTQQNPLYCSFCGIINNKIYDKESSHHVVNFFIHQEGF